MITDYMGADFGVAALLSQLTTKAVEPIDNETRGHRPMMLPIMTMDTDYSQLL